MSTLRVSQIQDITGANSSTPLAISNGIAKAWVNFNGTGVISIRSSYNVSSITDVSVGNYRVNFTTPMVDTNYAVVASGGLDNLTNVAEITTPGSGGNTVSSASIHTEWGGSPSAADLSTVSVCVFR